MLQSVCLLFFPRGPRSHCRIECLEFPPCSGRDGHEDLGESSKEAISRSGAFFLEDHYYSRPWKSVKRGRGCCVHFYYSTDAAAHPVTMNGIHSYYVLLPTLPLNPLAQLNRIVRYSCNSAVPCRAVSKTVEAQKGPCPRT